MPCLCQVGVSVNKDDNYRSTREDNVFSCVYPVRSAGPWGGGGGGRGQVRPMAKGGRSRPPRGDPNPVLTPPPAPHPLNRGGGDRGRYCLVMLMGGCLVFISGSVPFDQCCIIN